MEDNNIILFIDSGFFLNNALLKMVVPKNMLCKLFRNCVYKCLSEECPLIKQMSIEEIFLTFDEEGKKSLGNDTEKINAKIKTNQTLHIKYYMGRNIWTSFFYKDLTNDLCKCCNLRRDNMINIKNGWSLESICNSCYINVSRITKDKNGMRRLHRGNIMKHCILCGNKGIFISKRCPYEGYLYGKCDKCLSPRERQCANCSIPVEFVELCKICKKTYCSDKCREEDKHNEKCK